MSTYKVNETNRALYLARTHIHEKDVGAIASLYLRLSKAESLVEHLRTEVDMVDVDLRNYEEENSYLADRVIELERVLSETQNAIRIGYEARAMYGKKGS